MRLLAVVTLCCCPFLPSIAADIQRSPVEIARGIHNIYEGTFEWLAFRGKQDVIVTFDRFREDGNRRLGADGVEYYSVGHRFLSVPLQITIEPTSLSVTIVERHTTPIYAELNTHFAPIQAAFSRDLLTIETSFHAEDETLDFPYIYLRAKLPPESQ